MAEFKPTNKVPVSDQSKKYDKNFKSTMNAIAPNVKLNETDTMLSEVEQSLKKKIFSLAKMEALVFSDPKLSSVYNEMAENGEEKYGYHYNETIQNMIFNDYVLNSPKYLQKYKMAIPKEKKRRDKSGINQLKKSGEETMTKTNPAFEPEVKKLAPTGLEKVDETNEDMTKVQFLVNEKDPQNPDLFAYFPEEGHDAIHKTGYSHVGQHSAVHPEYAAESRPATPEEYAGLKAELEGQGYNLEVINDVQETTGAAGGGAGAFVAPLGYEKKVEETTTSASSGAYVGPAAWGGGDLMKGGKSKAMRKPIWQGGTIIGESNYLISTDGFEKYYNKLNEEIDIENPAVAQKPNQTPYTNKAVNDKIIDKTSAFTSNAVKQWNKPDTELELNQVNTGKVDAPNLEIAEVGAGTQKIRTKDELKAFVANKKATTGKGLTANEIPMLADEALYTIAIQLADKMLPMGWDGLSDINSMWDYINRNGGMTIERLSAAVKRAVNARLKEEGYTLKDLGLGETASVGVSGSNNQERGQKIKDLTSWFEKDNQSGRPLAPTDWMNGLDDNALNTVHKNAMGQQQSGVAINEIFTDALIGSDVVDIKPQAGEKPFTMNDKKYQYEIAKYKDGHMDNVVYSFSDDVYYDYRKWRELMGLQENNIKEDTQTMIQSDGMSMSNKAAPTGSDQPSGLDMGVKAMNEANMNLLEELNNELNAYSIHHNKLKKMSEDRKPSALVLRDRVGSENETNFKKDLQHSGTKEIIDVEKELQWKDQQTDVGKNPQKLNQDIEKKLLSVTKGEALENVGDSANDEGDEIPKRNLSKEEQDEVNNYRLGLGDFVYDNEVGKRFEDRMKADMGDKLYKQRQDKLAFRGKAPMYNKDPQPVEDTTAKKVQFDKEQTGWNEREGLKEATISGKYYDELGKKRIVDFNLNEVLELSNTKKVEFLYEVKLEGMGNTYTNKVDINESAVMAMDKYKFYTDGKNVVVVKNPAISLNENDQKAKPVVNEQMNKMKHLLGYKPNDFVNTKNIKL